MREQLSRTAAAQRASALMITLLGSVAMALAATGLYSVMSFSVPQRRRELGLRMALGVAPQRLLRMVMASGVRLSAAGDGRGAVAALACLEIYCSGLVRAIQFPLRPPSE